MNEKKYQKKVRLLHSNEFNFVFQKPNRTQSTSLTLLSRLNKLEYPRIGMSISKKYIKHAHNRNKIKRYARETFRIYQHNLSKSDFVLTVHSKNILYINNNDLIQELTKLWYHYIEINN